MSFNEYVKIRTNFIKTLPKKLTGKEIAWLALGHYLAYRDRIK